MPLATIMRALFTGRGLGYYHSFAHPLPDPIMHNPIRVVDLDGDKWWQQLEESLGNAALRKMHIYVVEAWNSMRMDNVFAGARNISMEEGLLVCHFLELAVRAGTYPHRSVVIVTTHYAQMVWLKWCVWNVGNKMSHTMHPIVLGIATVSVPSAASPTHVGLPGVSHSNDHERHLEGKHTN